MNTKFLMALWSAKIASVGLKITHHRGTDFPGTLALKICPDFAKYIEKPKKIIGITGTNGKTTTTNLICDLLEQDEKKVLCNRVGSNCLSGLLTCLIHGVDLFGKCAYDYAVLEIDERSSRVVFPDIQPEILVVTNLTRDSIMRNAHPHYIAWILSQYMPQKTKLVLNADDLITVSIAPNNQRVYFGIESMNTDTKQCVNLINDLQICPNCHAKLGADSLRYHHIGKVHCPACGYKNPESDYEGQHVALDLLNMIVSHHGKKETVSLISNGLHDAYNVMAAFSVLSELGYAANHIAGLLKKTKIVSTRYSISSPKTGYRVIRQMSKDINSVATSRAFDHVSKQPGKKEVILMMFKKDHEENWSENISWLYDCDFEFLNHPDITNIVCTGPRWSDYVLRLEMAGIPKERISIMPDRYQSHTALKLNEPVDIYVLFGTDSIEMSETVANNVSQEIKKKGRA